MSAALDGVRIADFSHVFAGPYCTLILADMGAEVIKIEPPKGDTTRGFTPPDLCGESPTFLYMNRNKKGVVLDMSAEEGKQVALDIVARADILMENFATGVMQRLGLDYDTVAKLNPRLIYCSISAYGRTGRFADRPGYDPVVQAETGLLYLNGFADGEPHKSAMAMIDMTTGMFAAHAILAALYARVASGRGQFIDVPLFDNAASLGSYQTMNYLVSGKDPTRLGNKSPVTAPVDLYDAQDGKFFMTIGGDRVWQKLVKALGMPQELQSTDLATNSGRLQNEPRMTSILQRLFGQIPLAQLLDRLRAAGVPVGPVRSIAEAVDSPEMKERAVIGTAPHTGAGTVPNLRLPMAISGTPLIAPRGAPLLGEHTHSVLADLLQYTPDRIADLENKRVIVQSRKS